MGTPLKKSTLRIGNGVGKQGLRQSIPYRRSKRTLLYLIIVRRADSLRREKFSTEVAERYGECSEVFCFVQEWPRQTKPKKGQFMNFSQGHSGTKVRCVNRACFPKENTRIHEKMGEIHMNFSFWPFLWFGLPGRLLILGAVALSACHT